MLLFCSSPIKVLMALLSGASLTSASWASTILPQAQDVLPSWASQNTLQLKLDADPTNYAVIPLVKNLGLNASDASDGLIHLNGRIISATKNTNITNSGDVAYYMSCDTAPGYSQSDKTNLLNNLMTAKPKPRAIILYSNVSIWCSIGNAEGLKYPSLFSMVDPAEAIDVSNHINNPKDGQVVNLSIVGNTTAMGAGSGTPQGPKSAIAMSVLYGITGFITLLFLVIILAGAVRAHRHPERYGPRHDANGRPRQSRAKGLARAVLETLPIVKFGDQQDPSKRDPENQTETPTTSAQNAPSVVPRDLNSSSDPQASSRRETQECSGAQDGAAADEAGSPTAGLDSQGPSLGCSICTEDFKVGEDVRVLPCNHQFHPTCVDPWLMNVSGTCPLCRLDLRPSKQKPTNQTSSSGGETGNTTTTAEGATPLPPPLEVGEDRDHIRTRNRLSRIFNINQLRQATAEEQIGALRRLRQEGNNNNNNNNTNANETETHVGSGSGGGADGVVAVDDEEESRRRGIHLANKLKEKFRILTRSQPESHRGQC